MRGRRNWREARARNARAVCRPLSLAIPEIYKSFDLPFSIDAVIGRGGPRCKLHTVQLSISRGALNLSENSNFDCSEPIGLEVGACVACEEIKLYVRHVI
jgi:hypothetical protein